MAIFGVHRSGLDAEGSFLDGRVYAGKVSISDVFIVAFDPFSSDREEAIVSITIKAIETYGRRLPSLHEGMTGRLLVEGASDLGELVASSGSIVALGTSLDEFLECEIEW